MEDRRRSSGRGWMPLAALLLLPHACRSLPDGQGGAGALQTPGSGAGTGASPTAAAPPTSAPPTASGAAAPIFLRDRSQLVTWSCAGQPCPWGATLNGQALVWPTGTPSTKERLGYLVSAPIYLPAESANGVSLRLLTGQAIVYAGPPEKITHRALAMVTPGRSFRIVGLTPGNVASVQSDGPFSYDLTPAAAGARDRGGHPESAEGALRSLLAFWTCDRPGCTDPEWSGMVISWPAVSAYQSNGRVGPASRAVQTLDGAPLYPYMGPWADGCKVTARSGEALIVEWHRGAETWRETRLRTGQAHVISLRPPEDGALIESNDPSPGFSVTVEDCAPRAVP